MRPISRRLFLRLTAAGGLTTILGCERVDWAPEQTNPILPLVTPVDEAYVLTQGPVHPQNLGTFRLRVHGACENPMELSLESLQKEGKQNGTSYLNTMVCVFDTPDQDLCYTGIFGGIELKTIVEKAQPLSSVKRVNLLGADGFQSSLPISFVLDPKRRLPPICALTHNGAPLTHDHGRPLRAVVPGLYGYKSVKYLQEIELTTNADPAGRFESMLDTQPDRPTAGGTKIRQPLDTAWIPAGEILIAGYCLPGVVPTRRLELQIDNGPWQMARLLPLEPYLKHLPIDNLLQFSNHWKEDYPFSGVWAPWTYRWNALPGHHVIRARVSTMPDWRDRDTHSKAVAPWIDEVEVQVG